MLSFLAILILVSEVSGHDVTCYKCENCEVVHPKQRKVDCFGSCYKATSVRSGQNYVSRGCYTGNCTENTQVAIDGEASSYHCCHSNYCNSAHTSHYHLDIVLICKLVAAACLQVILR